MILDCNNSVTTVYGYTKEDLRNTSFLSLFPKEDQKAKAGALRTFTRIDTARQIRKDGQMIYVNIGISASEYSGQAVFLVTTSDVTVQLMAQQQLIQASKMATLGEMATGVAHELNQPLSVIKTASSFIGRKGKKGAPGGRDSERPWPRRSTTMWIRAVENHRPHARVRPQVRGGEGKDSGQRGSETVCWTFSNSN